MYLQISQIADCSSLMGNHLIAELLPAFSSSASLTSLFSFSCVRDRLQLGGKLPRCKKGHEVRVQDWHQTFELSRRNHYTPLAISPQAPALPPRLRSSEQWDLPFFLSTCHLSPHQSIMTASAHISKETHLFPEFIKEQQQSSVQHKLNDLLSHLNAVVSIGTSNDEEEVMVAHPTNDTYSMGNEQCWENRNDHESIVAGENRGGAALERDDTDDHHHVVRLENGSSYPVHDGNNLPIDTTAAGEKKSAEIPAKDGDADASAARVKFGTHMIRDSVITGDDNAAAASDDNIGTEPATDCRNQVPTDFKSRDNAQLLSYTNNDLDSNRLLDKEESFKHLLGLVPDDNESILGTSSLTNSETTTLNEELSLKSILKKTNDTPHNIPLPGSNTHSLLFKFQKHAKLSIPTRHFKSTPRFCRRKQQRSTTVTFSNINLRTYEIILGDHPNCKFGAPLSIGWTYDQCHEISVDNYEKAREGQRRTMKSLYLNSACRKKLLRRAGVTVQEMRDAIQDVRTIQTSRAESGEDHSYLDDLNITIPSFTTGGTTQLNNGGGGKGIWNESKTKMPRVMVRLRHGMLSLRNLKRRSNF
jgi:hypothetical protein